MERVARDAPLYVSGKPVVMRVQPVTAMERVKAKMVDGVALFGVMLFAMASADFLASWSVIDFFSRVYVFVFFVGLYVALNMTARGSPGKRAMDVRIVDRAGGDAPLGKRAARWLAHYAFGILAVIGLCLAHLIWRLDYPIDVRAWDRAVYILGTLQLAYVGTSLGLIIANGQSLADRLSGTYVGVSWTDSNRPYEGFEVVPVAIEVPTTSAPPAASSSPPAASMDTTAGPADSPVSPARPTA